MNRIIPILTLEFALLAFVAFAQDTSWKYLKQPLPGDNPEVFAPGIVSSAGHEHSTPAISPDGTEIYWSVFKNPESENPKQTIFFVHCDDGVWSEPEIPSFSGKFSDGGPCFSRNGNRLYFYSHRPVLVRDETLKDDIWFVDRIESGWSEPQNMKLSDLSNRDMWIFSPSISDGGTIYITGAFNGVHGLFKMGRNSYEMMPPVALSDTINTEYEIFNWTPYIAPDESYLIFSSKREDSNGFNDLYISFKHRDGTWGKPMNMGDKINNGQQVRFPRVTRDGKYLFFTRGGDCGFDDVFWMSSSIIDELRDTIPCCGI